MLFIYSVFVLDSDCLEDAGLDSDWSGDVDSILEDISGSDRFCQIIRGDHTVITSSKHLSMCDV